MPEKTQSSPLLNAGEYTVNKVVELNFFDLTGEKAKTKGSSSKSYHAELQFSKKDQKAQIYTLWGPTGGNQTSDWRYYDSQDKAAKEFESIIKSKKRKGYQEIDVAQRAYGSDEAKQITKAVTLTNMDDSLKAGVSKLHTQTQKLISNLMGATNAFVAQTLKCPLGQLTNSQIDVGREKLNKAKDIVNQLNGKTVAENSVTYNEILSLTNDFYSLIPHNLGSGFRGKMDHLLLNDITRIVQKESDLDTLLDAKSIGAVLKSDSNIDDQYNTLDADLKYIEHNEPMYKFILDYFKSSKVRQHGFVNEAVKNVWAISRHGSETSNFLTKAKKIAKECSGYSYIKEAARLYDASKFGNDKRTDLDKDLLELYNKSNTWFCWHGTRAANVTGITKRGLLIRPAGAVLTGAMFGPGAYLAHQSTKSLNYCDGGYWTGGHGVAKKYMFLMDSTMGNMHVAKNPFYYPDAPKGFHSVFGKANISGVMNDEMIVYDINQVKISYLLEIE